MFVNVSSRDAGNSHHSSVKSDNNSLSYPSRTVVHPKLEMTDPGDADEREADAAAHDVMSGKVFRKFLGGGAGGGMAVSSQMESQLNQLQGGGQRMPDGLRGMMERGFDRDFSQVRLHTDGEAASLSDSIHAKAFTHGNDIYFNQGQYAPETSEGQRLVAHELAHVAQDGGKVGRVEEDNTTISVNDRVRRSEVMSNLRYCELRAESLIDDVKERKEMDSSLWGWLSNIGDDEFDADYLIDTLRICRSKLRDLRKCKNSIDEISRGVNEILRVIRMVESALAARRNNSIEGANKWVSGLRYTRDACFTTVGIIASVAVPATAAAAVSLKVVNAGMNVVDTVEDAKSLYENVQSGNVLGAIVDGASVVSDVVGFGGLKTAKNIGRGVDAAQSAGKGSKVVKDVKKVDAVQSAEKGSEAVKDVKKVDATPKTGTYKDGKIFEENLSYVTERALMKMKNRPHDVIFNPESGRQVRLVLDNGKGNVRGNRTDVDFLIKCPDNKYVIVEFKFNAKADLSIGQRAAKKHVGNYYETETPSVDDVLRTLEKAIFSEKSGASFKVRSKRKMSLVQDDSIEVKAYVRVSKFKNDDHILKYNEARGK